MDCANFVFHHPRGRIYGHLSEIGVQRLRLPQTPSDRVYLLHSEANIVQGKKLREALERYFAGVAVDFADIALDLSGATAFRLRVWKSLRKVRWGQTATYGDLAELSGYRSKSARAVGGAVGANSVPIIIPCHRVLPASGGLGGFSAGLDWKRELLRIEGHVFP